ncbi:MAG: class I SAM-dependent methyltransferase [Betaproteobacteria bacterium]|nr:class I SAM-dependent methyltransferase [Betaproteobacteria bacterium]
MSTPLRATVAFQELIGSMRQHWANQLYPALHERYRNIDHGATPAMADQAIAQISQTPLYQWFAFIERHYQRMKYSDPRWGLAANFESRPEWVRERLAAAESSPYLELNPTLPIPAYYREIDIHQHPGNLIGADYDGLMYQASATSIHPNTRRFEAHERFGDRVLSRRRFQAVLNMGCGFGKCTFPIAARLPEAIVTGIDLSAPCLRLAAATLPDTGLPNVRLAQRDALRSGYADASFDLVTSTQLLHELPVDDIRLVLQESFRLLEPGGEVMHLDFRPQGRWMEFLLDGHAVRNNEGFMPAFNRLDMVAAMQDAGFVDIAIEPFAETEGATRADWPYWRFPWTLFRAVKPL